VAATSRDALESGFAPFDLARPCLSFTTEILKQHLEVSTFAESFQHRNSLQKWEGQAASTVVRNIAGAANL
jgi:hypothetical protein